MSGIKRGLLVSVALAAAAVAGMIACEPVPLTAIGASIFLQANPTFVPANGGRSLVTALLTEPAGTLVPDGTVVFFFTNLGSIEERVKTVDGIARTYFVSDSHSGTATVTAYSGGSAPAPSASASPAAAAASGSGTGNASISIVVGSALPARVVVTADPQRITSPRQSSITANVFDANGNPVQNVPVIFKVDAAPLEETLDSGGAPQFTNSSGQAFDTLRTRAAVGATQKEVTVQAVVPTLSSPGEVIVFVN
jgi:hypothetical protein